MALPSLLLPATLPHWLAAGYASEPESIYGRAQMSTGHTRIRRVFTVADRKEQVSMLLSDAQLAAFHAWHELDLQAGLLPFAAQVANLGPGLVWFDALMLDYTSTPQPGGISMLGATLLLRGSPSATGPA